MTPACKGSRTTGVQLPFVRRKLSVRVREGGREEGGGTRGERERERERDARAQTERSKEAEAEASVAESFEVA